MLPFFFFSSAKPAQQKIFLLNGLKIETDQQYMIMTYEFKLLAHFLVDLITIYDPLYIPISCRFICLDKE